MDVVMAVGGILFSILFLFLVMIFIVVIISFSKTPERQSSSFQPSVSIVIPAYNEEAMIQTCISSIKKSGYPLSHLEIIVVDDGSTDRTALLAKAAGALVIKGKHQGKVAALNLGLSKAKHAFVATIDADTIVEQGCIEALVAPLAQKDVGATTGNSKVLNSQGILGSFQNIEYHYNNLIRTSFSLVFGTGIWFFGALACYRKSALKEIGFFKQDTLAEDMDSALELRQKGYRSVNVKEALGYTVAPSSIRQLFSQRRRWWMGTLQSLYKNRSLFSFRSPLSILFLFINQFWWSFYAFLSLPLLAYQVHYWLAPNMESSSTLFWYLFRWFTLSGPFYVMYKIPEWGISWYSIFGVLSGIISFVMIMIALNMFKDKLTLRNALCVFFYFPYTILLNTFIVLSITLHMFTTKRFFIK